MAKTAKELATGILAWCKHEPDMGGTIVKKKDGSVDIKLTYEGEEFFIQNYVDPGMTIKQVGSITFNGRVENIFDINGVLFGENTKAIAIWANGDID